MDYPCIHHSNSLIIQTSSALLCTILSQILVTQKSELWSELLSWILLPVLFKAKENLTFNNYTNQACSGVAQATSARPPWAAVVSISVFSLYKAEIGLVNLYPILLPLLQMVEKYLRLDASQSTTLLQPSTVLICFTSLITVVFMVTLSLGNAVLSAFSLLAVAAQVVLYGHFSPQDYPKLPFLPHLYDFDEVKFSLMKRTVPTLLVTIALQTMLFGFTTDEVGLTLLVAIFKALSWYALAQAARKASWAMAPIIQIIAMLSAVNYVHTSLIRATLSMATSLLALKQLMLLLKMRSKFRHTLWLFALLPLVPYCISIQSIWDLRFDADSTYANFINHPVDMLIQRGRQEFEGILQKQSQNYGAAEKEYRSRYGKDPSHGFEAWFNFAVSHKSPIIDDFDVMYSAISPFWRFSGSQVTQMMEEAYAHPASDLWFCEFESKSGTTRCQHAWRKVDRHIETLFNRLLSDFKGIIPDAKFLVNHLDEPRVLIPRSSQEGSVEKLNLTDLSHRPVWDILTDRCMDPSKVQHPVVDNTIDTFGLPFITSHASSLDLCQHSEYRTTHGLFQAPTSLKIISGCVPVLSTGVPSTMGDIPYPSPAYIEKEFQYDQTKDSLWTEKTDNLYWAGSTTGGFAKTDEWQNFHRQRFVTLAQGLGRKQYTYLRKRDGVVRRVKSKFLNSQFFQVAFTRIFQCDRRSCRDQKTYFRTKPWDDRNRAFQSRFTFDLDGNGISGRYYKLLASRSVPLKQTLLQEWHDNRLVPWVHYIPISQSMEELPELMSYLVWSKNGQKRAKEIAEQGREWFTRAMREVDMSIYMSRALLEIARLQDPYRLAAI